MGTISAPAGLGAWRAQLLDRVLRVMLLIGAVVAVPSVWAAVNSGFAYIAVVDVLSVLVVATLTFASGLGYRVRAGGLLLTTLVLGVALLPVVGLVGYLYLGAVPVLAALLLGGRAVWPALAVNAVILAAAGALSEAGDWILVAGVEWPLEWAVVTVNALFISGILALSSVFLLRRLEAAEAEAARLAVAVSNAPDAMVVADASGQIVSMNRIAATLAEQLTDGSGWEQLEDLAQSAEQRDQLRSAVARGMPVSLAMHQQFQSGVVEFAGQVVPIRQARGALHSIVAVFRDVTGERRTEAGLRRAEKLEALSVLASSTAHDFNNVLAQILAVAQAARSHAHPERIDADLDAIIGASDRARDLVKQLVAFGERSDQARGPIDVGQVVEASLPLLRAALSSTGVRIEVHLHGEPVVAARASEIEQIVTNLVTNAAHATARRPDPVVTVGVVGPAAPTTMSETEDGPPFPEQVVLGVDDNGRGIDPENLERIFEPFFTTRSSSGGTGLGLSSVRSIAESLGGSVTVTSIVGQGTTFRVALPAAPPRSESPDVDTTEHDVAQAHILLVDDEPLLRDLAAQSLVQAGYEVTTAADGEEALELYTQVPDRFRLLITDQSMPRLNGADLIGEARRLRPGQPAILCSGDLTDVALPGTEHAQRLAKPYTLTELRDAVHTALGRHASVEGDLRV